MARDLVDHDQRGLIPDDPLQQIGADGGFELLALRHFSVCGSPTELMDDLSPQCQGPGAIGVMNADGRVEIGADHASDLDLARRRQSEDVAQQVHNLPRGD